MDTLNGRNGRVGAGVAMILEMSGKLLSMAKSMPIQAFRDASWELVPLRLPLIRSVLHSTAHAECLAHSAHASAPVLIGRPLEGQDMYSLASLMRF